MIVHMTRLYTRLVTYSRLYILTLVVRISVIYRSYLCSWHWAFCYVSFQLSCYCLRLLCTNTFSFTHTLIRSLMTTLDSHVQDFWTLSYIVQVFVWSYALRGAGVSLILIIGILDLLLMLFPDSIFSHPVVILFSLFICYHCVRYLYVILQWYWFIMVDFIACSGYLRLIAYMWGIFLAYMRRRPSSRLRFRIFWEAGRDRYTMMNCTKGCSRVTKEKLERWAGGLKG